MRMILIGSGDHSRAAILEYSTIARQYKSARFHWRGESAILHAPAGAILTQWSVAAFTFDPFSYGHYDQVKTSALQMDPKADFAKMTLSGYAELPINKETTKCT